MAQRKRHNLRTSIRTKQFRFNYGDGHRIPTMAIQIFHWPDTVPIPTKEPRTILLQVSGVERTSEGRRKMREVLHTVLSGWIGGFVEWLDTDKGPSVRTLIEGKQVDVSLSYAGGYGWLGICCGGRIGVDAVVIDESFDSGDIAALYLEAADAREIREATDKAAAFAQRWSALEARCKLARVPLQEKAPPPNAPVYTTKTTAKKARIVISVALQLDIAESELLAIRRD